MKNNIIGHRGAAGLELENTETSIERALALNVTSIEIDVRLTEDSQLAACHDSDPIRIADDPRKVRKLTLRQLQKIKLIDGSTVPSLETVLKLVGERHTIIELKDRGSVRTALKAINKFPKANVSIASFNLQELALARELAPDMHLYGLERTKPFDCIHLARILDLDGVGLNYWLLNPLTYYYAHRSGLKVYVYTVNRRFFANFLGLLYPKVAICTDYPNWFVKKRRVKRPKSAPRKSAKIS